MFTSHPGRLFARSLRIAAVLAFMLLSCLPAFAAGLGDLLIFSPPPTLATIEGNSVSGNRFDAFAGYTNISPSPIIFNGVNEVLIVDPEDVGVPNLTLENVGDARAGFERCIQTWTCTTPVCH